MANGEEIGRAHNTRWKENVVSALAYMLQMYVMQMMNRRANSTSLFSPFFFSQQGIMSWRAGR